jgi:hypothetical protein
MARKYSKKSRRHHRGGMNAPDPSTYSSATTYGQTVNGTGNEQYNRVFSQTGPDALYPSNQSVGAQGQNLGYSPNTIQKAGKGRRNKGGNWGLALNQAVVPFSILGMQQTYRRKKKGGFLGQALNQAVVPLSILGMQQTYRRKKHGGKSKKTRKNRH